MSEQKIYDVLVIGGGPGGYTAALYCARAGMSVLVLEKLSPGGQMATTGEIDNYPGFENGVDGFELGMKMQEGAHRFGVETRLAQVTAAHLTETPKRLETTDGEILGRAVVVATGAYPRELGVEHESELRGRGVTYCATCDGMFYRGREVAVVGGGNSAVADALVLAKLCKKVTLIHRRDSLRASKVYLEGLKKSGVEIRWNSRVKELLFDQRLTGVRLSDVRTGEESELTCDGLFIAVGREPDTGLFRGQLEMDEAGYLLADETTRTNLPGVYAVGDVRQKPLRQIVTATADGAVAAHFIEEYLMEVGGA